MGNDVSIPANLDHAKLFEMTQDTRLIMNKILEYILKEVTLRDFVTLSDQAQCNKYVLIKANALYKYFYTLRIDPSVDKKGVISFRPIKEMQAAPYQDTERQSLCVIISYYYTRIIQIYGALALTLLDNANTTEESGLMNTSGPLLAPGFYRRTVGGKPVDRTNLGLFYFMHDYLEELPGELEYKVKYLADVPLNGATPPNSATIHFKPVNTYSKKSGKFIIGYDNINANVIINVTMNDIVGSGKTFEFESMEYAPKGTYSLKTVKIPDDILNNKKIYITDNNKIKINKDKAERDVKDYFNSKFNKLIPYLKKLTNGTNSSNSTSSTSTDTKIKESNIKQLSIKDTISGIRDMKPYGHCIARALQLLKTAPLNENVICNNAFLKIPKKRMSGLPKLGEKLSSSPGLTSLSYLFYDTIQNASVKIGVDGPAGRTTFDKYIAFMKNMEKLFTGSTTKSDAYNNNGPPVTLNDINNTRDPELCTKLKNKQHPTNMTDVNDKINELFKIQYKHSVNCGKIISQLFSIQQNPFSISLHPNIFNKGLPEIERINNLAREVLVEYYTNCETTFLYGVQAIIKST